MSKSFSTILLASTTALAACGGGSGGNSGDSPVNYYNKVKEGLSGVASSIEIAEKVNKEVPTAIVKVAAADQESFKESVNLFKELDKLVGYRKYLTNAQLNEKFEMNGKTYTIRETLQVAEGFYNRYYKGSEEFWNNAANGKYDDASDAFNKVKDAYLQDKYLLSEETTFFENMKKVNSDGSYTLEAVSNVKIETSKKYSHLEKTYGQPTLTIVQETEETADSILTYSVETTTTPQWHEHFDIITTTTITTYYNGSDSRSSVDKVVSRGKVKKPDIVKTEKKLKSTTPKTPAKPTPITIVKTEEETVKSYSHLDKTYGLPVSTFEDVVTKDAYIETTTRIITTRTPEFHEHFDVVTVYTVNTYSNGEVKKEVKSENFVSRGKVEKTGKTVVTEEVLQVVDLTPKVEEPPVLPPVVEPPKEETPITVVDTKTVVGNKYWSHVVKTNLDPVIEKVEDVVTYEGTIKVTTRYTTIRQPQIHEHFDAIDTTYTYTYSDGSTKTEVKTELFTRGPVNKPGPTRVETLEIARVDTYVPPSTPDTGTGDNTQTDVADMGTRTPGYVSDPTHYQTQEFNSLYNDQLSVSKFDVAYSRGWTGKGSTIVIADTGALTTHNDLNDNIKYTKDYTNTTMDNGAEHGTHVAGIAGAEKNGQGMHGAAFDANLAIAKVSSGYQYSFSNAKKAAAWGNSIGSVAINVSAEVNYDSAFRNSIVKSGSGDWYSTHWYYGENGYNGAVNEAKEWKTALGDEQVLVKAAGNAGWAYSAGMNQMATATDANGNLILDGQMIIVGNYDTRNGKINGSSNKAGTVCATYKNGVCIDAAKIKDYYIMADGTNVSSTAVNGQYVNMTGTSMAAPVVTGSIAVLHQMWPHMKGKHLVQLVLVTGNKNIAGYDENVHGQGLLDMDRATQPVGATGIPTSGRTNGGVSSVSGGAMVSGVSASQISALTDVMVLDSFERDFYIDLGDMAQSVDTRTASVAEQMGAVNYYSGYLNDQQLQMPVPISENANFIVGGGASYGHALGTAFQGTLGTTKDSTTVYANYNYRNGGFYAQAGVGVTHTNYDKTGMLAGADAIVSSTATVGYEFAPKENTTWGFVVSQPVTVESAKMHYNVPTARTLDGNVVSEMRTVDFKSADREIDLGSYYNFKLDSGAEVNTFAEVRTGVTALKKELEKRVGISVQLKF